MQNTLAQQRQVSRSCSLCCDLSENHRPLAKTQGMSLQTHTADPLLGVPIFVPIFCSDFFCYFSAEKLQKKIRNKNQNKNQGGIFPQQIWTPIDRVAYTWMQVLVWVRYSHQWLSTLTVSKLTLSLRLLLNVSLTECAQQKFMNSIVMESIQNFWSQIKSETNLCRNAAAKFATNVTTTWKRLEVPDVLLPDIRHQPNGVFGVSTWPIRCDTPSPFSEPFPPWRACEVEVRTPPPGRVKMEPFVLLAFFPLFYGNFWPNLRPTPGARPVVVLWRFHLFHRHFRWFWGQNTLF